MRLAHWCRPLRLGERRQLFVIGAVVLAAAIPGLAAASSSPAQQGVGSTVDPLRLADAPLSQAQPAATPQGGGVTATVSPNPAPMNADRTFNVAADAWLQSDCWDDRGHTGAPNFDFSMRVSSPFTWNVACYPSGGDSVQVVILPHPVGDINPVDSNGTVTGWACDPDNTDAALAVQLFIDGVHVATVTAGEWGGQGVADLCRGNPFHQFTYSIPQQWKDGAVHSISALALDHGGASHQWLNGSPQGFLIAPPPPPAPELVTNPTISPSTIQEGQWLSSTTGSWTNSPVFYRYQWLLDGAPIAGATGATYQVKGADVGRTIRSSVNACHDWSSCSATWAQSTNSVVPDTPPAPAPVSITEHTSRYVAFQNQDARYYIGLQCGGYNETIGNWKPSGLNAGPGYISKVVRLAGGERLVGRSSYAAHGLQGVGAFGTHLLRQKGTGSTAPLTWGVANANYCADDWAGLQNLPALGGVRNAVVRDGPRVEGDTGILTVDVYIRDIMQPEPGFEYDTGVDLLMVRYNIRVKPSVVYQWTTVDVLCGNGACRSGYTYFVKEPKVAVTLYSPDNDLERTSCWDSSSSWATTAAVFNWKPDPPPPETAAYAQYTKSRGTNPVTDTMRCVHGSAMPSSTSPINTRGRILFDKGGPTDEKEATVPGPIDCPSNPVCFIVTGRGSPPWGGPGTTLTRWEGTGSSFSGSSGTFDQWALKSASAADPDGGVTWWNQGVCNSSSKGTSSNQGTPRSNSNNYPGPDNRRWEIYGRVQTDAEIPNGPPVTRYERGALFKAWEGGSGPQNCLYLFRKLSPGGNAWGAFNAYSFGSGWEINPTPDP